jgi:trans-aconitate methyltransferase
MKKLLEPLNLVWRAEEYNDLSLAQQAAAMQVLEQLRIAADDHILDVGCGSGKISAYISQKVKHGGSVLAIDKSHEMINFASQNFPIKIVPNLRFKVQDAETPFYKNRFNIVFSSFMLQWLKDKNSFFKNSYSSLKKEGRLALIIPLGISPELEKVVKIVTALPEWQSFFLKFRPNWFFSRSGVIKHLVQENGFEIKHFFSCMQEIVFPSKEAFERYILLWFPYLNPLPQELKQPFFDQILDEYFKMLPPQLDNSVLLRIPRMDLIAKKLIF